MIEGIEKGVHLQIMGFCNGQSLAEDKISKRGMPSYASCSLPSPFVTLLAHEADFLENSHYVPNSKTRRIMGAQYPFIRNDLCSSIGSPTLAMNGQEG